MNEDADLDTIRMSLHDWQHQLSLMASEMEAVADENGFHALYELMSLVTDAASKVDEIRP